MTTTTVELDFELCRLILSRLEEDLEPTTRSAPMSGGPTEPK